MITATLRKLEVLALSASSKMCTARTRVSFRVLLLHSPAIPSSWTVLEFVDEVAEWLRRWTANPLGSARVGSNPIFVAPPQWFYGVMVSTLDFESSDPSSNLGRTWCYEQTSPNRINVIVKKKKRPKKQQRESKVDDHPRRVEHIICVSVHSTQCG